MIDYLLPRKIETLVTFQIKKGFQEYTIVRSSFFIKKETLAQVFSSEFCEISKNTFFTEHLWATVLNCFKTLNLTFRLYNLLQ